MVTSPSRKMPDTTSVALWNTAVRETWMSKSQLRRLRAARPYRLVRSLDGKLREFEYAIDADRFLRILNSDRERPDVLDAHVSTVCRLDPGPSGSAP